MSNMDELDAQIAAGVAKSERRSFVLELIESAYDNELEVVIDNSGKVVIYTGVDVNDPEARRSLTYTGLLPEEEES